MTGRREERLSHHGLFLRLTRKSDRSESELMLWRNIADFDAKYLRHFRPVSFEKTSRDTDVSNPLRSAKQSAIIAFSAQKLEIPPCSPSSQSSQRTGVRESPAAESNRSFASLLDVLV